LTSHKASSTRLFSSPSNTDSGSNAIDIDPYSEEAKQNLAKLYDSLSTHSTSHELSEIIDTDVDKAHKSLLKLTEQVLQWNQRLNLVSRKDCTASVVYHRHVLPSVALLPLIVPLLTQQQSRPQPGEESNEKKHTLNVVDVGTGGGFPGLPLALLLPRVHFTLVDSVQKKLVAVSEMASELDISNVRIHCGRVEEMYASSDGRREHYKRYDIVLGRSVTALPRFCAWVADLLKCNDNEEGKLVYIIGGDLEEVVQSRIQSDTPIDALLQREANTSDKRALVFSAQSVREIAEESGEKFIIGRNGSGQGRKKNQDSPVRNQGRKLAKGEWSQKRNDVKKVRGYEDFKRYEF
jgi:16S rRNA (guanine527-N7)-methyltransferase